jgi:alkylresorcinol/alkylpyrone synthase
MLKTASKVRRSRQAAASFDVEIAGVATAVPAHRLSQNDAASRAKDLFPQLAGHGRLFHNTGIKTRYACEPPEWYGVEHGWEARTEIFLHHALLLLEEVARGAIDAAGIGLKDVRAIVVNTITGLAIPSLDAKLMNRLDLPASVERLPIFGLGCGGGVGGLARAAEVGDDPIAEDLQRDIRGDERPENEGVRRDQEEQGRDPGKVRRGDHGIIGASHLAAAGDE